MSQAVFAKVLYVSPKTVQSWEQGVRVPSMAARRRIHVFAEQPGTVCKVVGLPPVTLRGFTIRSVGKGKRRIVVGHRSINDTKSGTARSGVLTNR
jgi:DNA-binding XRE family transcriptional regulator